MANTVYYKNFYLIALFSSIWTIFQCISVAESISCYECSSLDDTDESYCPEFMIKDDESIVPYNSCSRVHEGAYCVKTTGVTGGTLGLECYRCDETTDEDFSCTDILFDAKLHDCSDVFDAQYCIKTTGTYGGSLGTRRFCSSRDMGNYCEYIKRPGDQHQYRSCVFTCSSNGCNPAETISPDLRIYTLTLLLTGFLFTTAVLV